MQHCQLFVVVAHWPAPVDTSHATLSAVCGCSALACTS